MSLPVSPARARWRRWLPWALALLVALLAWGVLRWRPVAVDAVSVQQAPLLQTLQFSARVKTPARVELGSTLTARVAKVLAKEGEAVRAGQALILLEDDEARATLLQAEASLQQAQARLQGQQALSLPSAVAALSQAQANELAAERERARAQELVAQGFYSQQKLDEAQRVLDVAKAAREAARAQVQANGLQGTERGNVLAQLDAAQAARDAARARLALHTIRAPAEARVLVRSVEPGQIVQAGKALLTVAVAGAQELLAPVDERFLAQLKAGQRARVLADAYPDRPFGARIERLAPSVNAQSGSVEVTLVVEGEAPDFLREDMTLSVEVVTGSRDAARVLPLRALRSPRAGQPSDRAVVLVVESGRAVERELTLGLRTLSQVEVLFGLSNADRVLLDATLAAGQRVSPRTAEPARKP